MSFYSSLELVANWVERAPTDDAVWEIVEAVGLRDPATGWLSPELHAVFQDAAALAENPRFFAPDSLGFRDRIQVMWWDGLYEGPGYSFGIHGNGYFFPWELSEVADRFLALPKLVEFRRRMHSAFGGGFRFPDDPESSVHDRQLSDSNGWVWFGSES